MAAPSLNIDHPPYHATLEDDDGNWLGFIFANGRGEIDHTAIQRIPIRRTGLRLVQGDTEYSDLEDPWTNIAQEDWSGGGGLLDAEDDTRYWHGFMTNTMHQGKVFLSPQPQYTIGDHRDQVENLTGSTTFYGLYGNTLYIARKFSPSATFNADNAQIWAKKVGTPNGNLTVELWTDDGGSPSVPSAIISGVTDSKNDPFDWISQLIEFNWAGTTSLTGGTNYWIVAYGHSSDDASNHWAIGCDEIVSTSAATWKGSGSWVTEAILSYPHIHFRVLDTNADAIHHFFEYKRALYCVTEPDAGGAAKLFINGDRGRALGTQTSTTLKDTSKSWTADEWIGSVVYINAGTGKDQFFPISDNDTDTLTIDGTWDITPVTANSEYVILASDQWTEIGTTGLTTPVTDVLVSGGVVYFCQTGTTVVRRMQWVAPSTYNFADDTGNVCHFLIKAFDSTNGAQVWRATNTSGGDPVVSRSPVRTWGTDLDFSSGDIVVGDRDLLITGLERYEDPEVPYVLKEDSVFKIESDKALQVPLREMASIASRNNGRAHIVNGVFLYFSLGRGVERFSVTAGTLDDVGPNRDDGLQPGYQGPIVHMTGYPGRIYAAVVGEDQTTSNVSSIQVNNGLGWHRFYRSQLAGRKIRELYHQVIPGTTLDRLWISEGTDIIWLPMPSETLDPTKDSNYLYFHEGMIQTTFEYLELKDIPKTYNELKLWCEELVEDEQYLTLQYGLDEADMVDLSDQVNSTPVQTVSLSTVGAELRGRRIRFIAVFHTTDETKTPILKATTLEAVAHIPTKYRYAMPFRVEDINKDLNGQEDGQDTESFVTQMDSWATDGKQLTLRSIFGPFDNKRVFFNPASVQPFQILRGEDRDIFLGQSDVMEA